MAPGAAAPPAAPDPIDIDDSRDGAIISGSWADMSAPPLALQLISPIPTNTNALRMGLRL
jgi:hypothetical protein